MNNFIKNLLLSNFNKLLQSTKIACPKENLHNSNRLKFYNPGKVTYDGKLNCGITSYLTSFMLSYHNIDHKVWLSKYGFGDYLEDHVHITTNSGLLIDTTYRQFFIDYRSDGNCDYYKYLFETCEPIFVGSPNEFDLLKKSIERQNIKVFGSLNQDIKELSDFWKQDINITPKMNLYDMRKSNEIHPTLLVEIPSLIQPLIT
ncbi:hypothetical protein CPAV1605_306 [seawater metagenome]|uniref:Uncharacterized protein n=1 Tax=seawater metagenome TaxID=1561972 RepID=A0A5E8CHA1_9ZZZZ